MATVKPAIPLAPDLLNEVQDAIPDEDAAYLQARQGAFGQLLREEADESW